MDLKFINQIINRQERGDLEDSLGFGHAFDEVRSRLINEDGTYNIQREGQSVKSMYLDLIAMSWPRFFGVLIAAYLAINALFGMVFYIIGVDKIDGIEHVNPLNDFFNAFFFSIQTFTTVGYGHLSPNSLSSSFVASLDSFTGLLAFALATGLFFARFSKAEGHIGFSEKMLISPYKDGTSLQIRLVHLRDTKIIGLDARVILTWLEKDDNNNLRRKFQRLELEIDSIFLFPLNWTIVHVIDENSPLFGCTKTKLQETKAEVLILVKGHDESYGKIVHANKSYDCTQLIENARFKPMYETVANKTILHMDRIDNIEKL